MECRRIYLLFCLLTRTNGFLSSHTRQRRFPPPLFVHKHRHEAEQKFNLTLCLVDHYDSYTYNLYDMLASLCIEPPTVVAKDCDDAMDASHWDGLILSPGPGRPPQDTGISLSLIQENPSLPILGVCLGHQALGYAYGASIEAAQEPIHGQVRSVVHDGTYALWQNVSSPLSVVRYHSLVVENVDSPLIPTAMDDKGSTIMALSHETNPHFGVQFHPESIGTQEGYQLVQNFLTICQEKKEQRRPLERKMVVNGARMNGQRLSSSVVNGKTAVKQKHTTRGALHVLVRKAHSQATPSNVYTALYGNTTHSVWLDSSSASSQKNDMARFSIMAAMDGPLSRRTEYDGSSVNIYNSHDALIEQHDMDIMTYLQTESSLGLLQDDKEDLPFEYRGGYIGYLGYEVRHDTQRALQKMEHGRVRPRQLQKSNVPTAAFLFADQSLVYDHWTNDWYMVGVSDTHSLRSVQKWMTRTERLLRNMVEEEEDSLSVKGQQRQNNPPLAFVPNRSPQTYRENIASCHEMIRLGESYELCLTNQLEATVLKNEQTPLQLYKILRERNPAPFAAFINFQSVSICSSSPERFVSVKQKAPADAVMKVDSRFLHVEAKPIKGTCAREVINGRARTEAEWKEDFRRARELETCVKNRAENLMIVDLLRNDLSRVCEVGSVHVPKLMDIEPYATVHQMVSTIRGALDPSKASAINVLSACFPGGSMTGAPKLRTTEILDEMEQGVPRGPYSGCLGYISLNGSMDMNIVIRSAVLTPQDDRWKVSIGAGGAITALSESEDEYEEMLLKARAVVEAVQLWADVAPMPATTKNAHRLHAQ